MKILRACWLWTMYILSTPFILLGLLCWIAYEVTSLIFDHGHRYFGDGIKGFFDGFKQGHKINMRWVEYGNRRKDEMLFSEEES